MDKAIEDRDTLAPAADEIDGSGKVIEPVPEDWSRERKRFGTSD